MNTVALHEVPMKCSFKIVIAFAAVFLLVFQSITLADSKTDVVPIDWTKISSQPAQDSPHLDETAEILVQTARYNLNWIRRTYKDGDPEWNLYQINGKNEKSIRPPASAAYALAVVLKTGLYDEKTFGLPREEALRTVNKLIRGLAHAHGANTFDFDAWGDQWQSALWASLFCHAAWIIWDELTDETHRMIRSVIEDEANRFIWGGYKTPYWNGKGGDSKAEENAWNAAAIQIAIAMMPNHPYCPKWKAITSELMVSSFSLKSDMSDMKTIIDGKAVGEWLNGYNLHDEGYVINHKLIHTDYMVTIKHCMRAFITQSLAGKHVPESADFNYDVIYDTLTKKKFDPAKYEAPGGTMYIENSPNVYYPTGTDWSTYRYDIYYLMDAYAYLLGFDKDYPFKASQWMTLRANRIKEMQVRFTDGHTYAKGEYDTYAGREQILAWQFADAYLLLWLDAHGVLQEQANWLEE